MNSIRPSWFNVLAAALVAGGCQGASPDPGAGAPSDEPAPSRVGPEEVLRGATDQLRSGFQPSGDAFVAGGDTHDATIRAGSLTMVPYHFDGARTIEGAPVTFATGSIRRGEQELAGGDARTWLEADGTIAIERGAAVESGQQTVASSRTGLHFLSGDRLGASYSHATWVDAGGTSWRIPVAWDGQRIAMRVPASVLGRSSYPAVLDPVIGPERTMDTPVDGFTGGSASDSQLAGSGGNVLAVWTDRRNGNEREARSTRPG